jgi:hypothetical protein
MRDFFIAVYTHEVKSYCDIEFFSNIANFALKDYELHVVDNTSHLEYTEKLKNICDSLGLKPESITHIDISEEPAISSFQRKVCDSVNFLRDKFLESGCKYFVIIESDVISPIDVLEKFLSVIDEGDIIGGIYYEGRHLNEWFDPEHNEIIDDVVFSGCTLYKRDVIESIKFRIAQYDGVHFPDTIMSIDACNAGYRRVLYTGIKCKHSHAENGSRNHIRL